MACCNPFPVYSPNRELLGHAPCGKCVNCIIDTRNRYDDLCQEEAYQFSYMCSYVTLTYDKYHLPYVDDWHGNLKATLKKNDYIKFVKRLRQYINYHQINNIGCRPDFKYLVCGEYGEKNEVLPRPHFHFIFFGLDYRFCAEIFRKCWTYGQLKILPVQSGCFRYVCSYISKQVHSFERPQEVYEKHNLIRPFLRHSVGLGATLFKRQRDFIMQNDFCYKSRKGALRPVPIYYLRKYGLIRGGLTNREKKEVLYPYTHNKKPFSFKLYNQIMHQNAINRAKSLAFKLRAHGDAVNDIYNQGYLPVSGYEHINVSIDIPEYISALTQYEDMEIVSNDDVLEVSQKFPDIFFRFVDSDLRFAPQKQFPTYKNIRQVAYDLKKFGSLVPF